MVKVDQNKCIGCGLCASVCSSVFEMQESKAKVKSGKEESNTGCVDEAVSSCPASAISK